MRQLNRYTRATFNVYSIKLRHMNELLYNGWRRCIVYILFEDFDSLSEDVFLNQTCLKLKEKLHPKPKLCDISISKLVIHTFYFVKYDDYLEAKLFEIFKNGVNVSVGPLLFGYRRNHANIVIFDRLTFLTCNAILSFSDNLLWDVYIIFHESVSPSCDSP